MTQPTQYTPTTDFSQDEANNVSGRSTVNTAALDAEFANIETTIDSVCDNLALIQRDDGRLADLTVEHRCLSQDVLTLIGGFNLRGLWVEATDYAVNDICSSEAYTYCCKEAHTSGTDIADDLAKWIQFGFTSGADAAQAAAAAQTSATAAAGSASSAATSATNAANSALSASSSASTATSSAISSASSASYASTSASNAANSAAAAAAAVASGVTASSTNTLTNKTILANANVVEAKSGPSGSPLSGLRNAVINGCFRNNQRGVSGSVSLSAGEYGHDRWKAGENGCSYTFSTSNNITTITVTDGSLMQVIEGFSLQSGTHVLSWTGTAQGRIDAGGYGGSGITGTSAGGTNQTIEFGTGTISKVQYEEGSISTPFEHRPIGFELSLCQRYYEVLSGRIVISAKAGVAEYLAWQFKVTKRVIPTITYAVGSIAVGVDNVAVSGVLIYGGSGGAVSIEAGSSADAEL